MRNTVTLLNVCVGVMLRSSALVTDTGERDKEACYAVQCISTQSLDVDGAKTQTRNINMR